MIQSQTKQKITIIIPVYNEERNVTVLYANLKKVVAQLSYEFEIVFVNDASTDSSQSVLESIAVKDPTVRVIEFVRNFGKEIATTAGIRSSQGDACIMIDADSQHPVELIPEFIQKWERGADVVVGIRKANQGEGWVKRIGSYWFYKIINAIGHTKLIANETDFRLLDREVIDAFNQFTEQNRITRGLVDWLGYNRDFIYFTANQRADGLAGYSLIKLTKLAFNSFISLSLFPLRLAGYLGLLITALAAIIGVVIIIFRYLYPTDWGASITSSGILAILLLFLVGILLISIGLIALYIANIHTEVINRPLYVVRKNQSRQRRSPIDTN